MTSEIGGKGFSRNDYILQPQNGGSGFDNIEDLKKHYGLVTLDNINAPGGILGLVDGKIPASVIGSDVQVYDSVGLSGPSYAEPLSTIEYTILNYQASRNYAVSFDGGYAAIAGNKITIVVGQTPGLYTLMVGGELYKINIVKAIPSTPEISATVLRIGINVTASIFASTFTADNDITHIATDWEISDDVNFGRIIAISTRDRVNKNSIDLSATASGMIYIRARFLASNKVYSEWSTAVALDTSLLIGPVGTPTLRHTSVKNFESITVTAFGSPFVQQDGLRHTATSWEFSSDNFKSITDSVVKDSQNLISITKEVITEADTVYVRAKYHDEFGNESAWSIPVEIKKSELFSTNPTVETAIITKGKQFASGVALNYKGDGFVVATLGTASVAGGLTYYKKSINGAWIEVNSVTFPSAIAAQGSNLKASDNLEAIPIGTAPGSGIARSLLIYGVDPVTDTLVLKQTITSTDGNASIQCWVSASASADGATVIGFRHDIGAVYIHSLENGVYVQKSIISGITAGGVVTCRSIDISPDGNRIAVGDYGYNSSKGRVLFYHKNLDGTWALNTNLDGATLFGAAATCYYGLAIVFCNNDMVAIGSDSAGDPAQIAFQGFFHIATYRAGKWFSGPGTWSPSSTAQGYFGAGVASANNGERIAVSCIGYAANSGNIYIFQRTAAGGLYIADILLASRNVKNMYYGRYIAYSGNGSTFAACTSPISTNTSNPELFIYERQTTKWSRISRSISNQFTSENTGRSITVSGDGKRVFIAVPSVINNNLPYVVILSKVGDTWMHETSLSQADKGSATSIYSFTATDNTGSIAVVGDPWNSSSVGAIYTYVRTGTTWAYTSKILSADNPTAGFFGAWVRMTPDGQHLLVSGYTYNNLQGRCYYYKRSGNTWAFTSRIDPTGITAGGFGVSSCISDDGTVAVFGAMYANTNTGAAQVYTRNVSTNVWTWRQTFVPETSNTTNGYYGEGVAISSDGTIIAVGGSNTVGGVVQVYKRTSDTTWVKELVLVPPEGYRSGKFGHQIAISKNNKRMVIGAANAVSGTGRVFIYEFDGTAWNIVKILSSPVASYGSTFLHVLAMDSTGDTIAVGLPSADSSNGVAYIYQ